MTNQVVMITGGSGFVGSHLVELLLAQDCEVHVFDKVPLDHAANLATCKNHPLLHYTQGDLRDGDAVRAYFRPEASCLYHLASVVGVRHYMNDPMQLIDVVVGGTRTLLDLAVKHETRVLFTSTSEIYGKNPKVPWAEDDDRVLGPASIDRWSYSSSKAVCEHMLYALHRSSGLKFSIVRFFNAYGPRQNPIYVVSQSIYRAIRGERPFLYDDGQQTRCFTYIDDIVRGVREAANNPKAVGEAFNLGNPIEITMQEIVNMVLSEVGTSIGWEKFETQTEYGSVYEDIPRRIPNIDKANQLLNWKPEIPVAEGITRTVSWARENSWWLS